MKSPYIAAFSLFLQCSGGALADELHIEFDDDALKAFGVETPLMAQIIRTKEEIEIRLANVSTKHLVITKRPHGSSSTYEAADGSKQAESAWATLSTPPDGYDHIVLRPKSERKDDHAFSSWSVFKMRSTHPDAKTCVFATTFSGYFPTVDQYLTFTINGRIDLSPETKEGEPE